MAIFEAEAERVIDGLVFRRVLGRHQKLHRADFQLRMLRQMAGVITTHEAGIGLQAERAAQQSGVEGGGFVDALPARDRRSLRRRRQMRRRRRRISRQSRIKRAAYYFSRSWRRARSTLDPRNEHVFILANFAADRPPEGRK